MHRLVASQYHWINGLCSVQHGRAQDELPVTVPIAELISVAVLAASVLLKIELESLTLSLVISEDVSSEEVTAHGRLGRERSMSHTFC